MKNLLKTTRVFVKTQSVNAASAVLGTVHFVNQSIADIAVELESEIKLKADGVPKKDTRQCRVLTTIVKQQDIMDIPENTMLMVQSIRGKFRRDLFKDESVTMNIQDVILIETNQ